ncbi:MAG TPA: type II toxin-antitoxin system Phd/YefM family antitoxin [Longimicrobiales bacterium]|nr:type II toxin-antitoxin system Phd/YefM family antitoxin [Longimicrobiales bacterium]
MKKRPPAGTAVEVPASEVKKGWHHYVDRVAQARETIVVTRYGRPVAKLSPMESGDVCRPGLLIGALAGTVTFHGDVLGPTGETWEADG